MIVIIDSGVADYQHLISGIVDEARIVLLDATQDGIEQITQALRENTDITEIHLISHGSPGSLQLGNSHLSLDTLEQYGEQLKSWFPSNCLTPSLLLYGCNVAAGDAGEEFIEKLHNLTGAEIAASTTKTGDAALGGDWNLEVQTHDFDVALALSEEARATYRFVFPEGISNLTTENQPAEPTPNIPGEDENENPITINFGVGNNIALTGFTNDNNETFEASDEELEFVLRRVDNDLVPGTPEAPGNREIVWFEGTTEGTTLDLNPGLPSDSISMEQVLSGDVINRGTDNIFANTGNNNRNNNNIERVDYISVGGLPIPNAAITGLGFLILERGGNDPFGIAAITELDANGDPSAFGTLVEVGIDDWEESTNPELNLDTRVLQQDPDGTLINTADPDGVIASVYVSYDDLGLDELNLPNNQFFGYALFPDDVSPGDNLVDFNSFPTNTPDEGGAAGDGGLDLIAGGVVFSRVDLNLPPIAIDDTAVTELGQPPIEIDVLGGDPAIPDDDDSDPDNGPQPLSIVPDGFTFTNPEFGSTVTINDQGTPDTTDDVVVYTPGPNFPAAGGQETFTYTITDRGETPATATVTVTVNAPATTTVGGNVFTDTDGNDAFDAGEQPLPTITVNLINDGITIDTIETSADGVYLFEGVAPGEYTVQVDIADADLPAGATLGTLNDLPVNAVAGEPSNNNNFGFDIPPVAVPDTPTTTPETPITFNITDNDTDDGTVDPTTVDLDPETPGQQTERTVPEVGTYTVDPTGEVTFTPEPGFTGPSSTINYTVEDNAGTPSAPTPITVTVTAPETTTVSGTVFGDSDGLDDLTAGEPLLPTITVNLVNTGGIVATVETVADGSYQFDGVVPGDYTVQVDTADTDLPAGATLEAGENDLPITVAANQPQTDINFGFDIPPATTPDTATTTPDTPVTLNVTENDTDDGTVDPTTVDLDPETPGQQTERTVPEVGTYTVDPTGEVTFTPEPGFTGPSTINYTVEDNVGTPSAPTPITVTVTAPNTTTVSGTVFGDSDGLDDLTAGEPLLPTITVNLIDGAGAVAGTAETDANGFYQFDGVVPGLYTVQVDTTDPELPAGATPGTGNDIAVTVAANQPQTDINFGFDIPPATTPDTATTTPDTPVTLNVTENDTDDGTVDPTTVDLDPETPEQQTERTVPGVGTYTVDPTTGVVTFTPEPGFTGPSTINYTVEDNTGTPSAPTPITVTVTAPTGFPISGSVFVDEDGTDTPTPDEPPLSGITVNLLNQADQTPVVDGDGNPITATTDDTGNYTFPNVPNGNYLVTVDENDPDIPDGFDLGTPVNQPVVVAGEPEDGINFGFDPAPLGFPISGSVYSDFDGSDTPTPDEPRLPEITVNLLDSEGNVFRSTTTDENGNYVFNNVLDGQYTIPVDASDPDIPAGFSLGTPQNLPVTVAGQFVGGFNFGFDPTPDNLPVSGTVFTDVNTDGSPTPDEPRLDGITVNLLNPDETQVVDGNGDPITATTDPNGNYVFDNVLPGNYLVQVDETDEDLPDGAVLGTPNNQPIPVATQPVGGINFGFNPVAPGVAVSGTVFTDEDGDNQLSPIDSDDDGIADREEPPLAGITVNLVDTNGEVVATTPTDEDGNYVFNNIPDGDYTVQVDEADDDVPPGFSLGTDNNVPVTVAGQPEEGINFGFDPAPVGQPVSGTVFNDVNEDDQDTDEPPLADITVNLLSNGNIIDTTTTDPDGNYVFNNVPDGEYTVEVDVSDEDLPDGSNVGTDNPLTVTVAGTPQADNNFGFDITPGNIPPEATDETVTTPLNEPVSFSLTDNVSDPNGDDTVVLTSIDLDPETDGIQDEIQLPEGTFTVDDEASVTFTPVDGFVGTATTPYTVQDNQGATSDPANIAVTVSPNANQAPEAQDVTTPPILNTDLPILLPLTPDQDFSDTDGTVETITINLPPASEGTLFLNGTAVTDPSEVEGLPLDQLPNITFAPNPLFAGTASFTYTVTDNNGEPSNLGNIAIPVVAPQAPSGPDPVQPPEPSTNQPPVAENITTTITNDGDPSPLPTLPATDSDGTITSYTITGLPAEGTLLVDGQEITSLDQVQDLTPEQVSQLTFEPEDNFSGEVLLSFTATDDDGAVSSTATATIIVAEDPSIPRVDPIDDGGCDCPPLPDVPAIPLPERPDFTPSAESGVISGTDADENIAGSNANDVIIALDGDDVIEGFDGGDVIFSGDGNELQFGDAGNDILFGELGNDSLIAGNGGTGPAPEGVDDDIAFGNEGDDLLQGGPGEDLLFSGKGDDFSYAGENDDILWGDLGNDTLLGDEGNDTIFGDIDNEDLLEPERGLAGMRDLILGGDGNDSIDGNRSNDTLGGGDGNDTIRGGKEDDLIHGEAGDDLLFGELGNDHIAGGEGNDTMFGDVLASFDSEGEESDTLCGGEGNDLMITNVGSDQLCGGADNDSLYGGQGNDTLAGEAGDDWLFGDEGDDEVSGGSGSDRFILFSDDGSDTILDFQLGQDLIALGGGLTFEQLTITQSGTSTIVSLDGQQLATLNDVQSLGSDDFTTFAG